MPPVASTQAKALPFARATVATVERVADALFNDLTYAYTRVFCVVGYFEYVPE